MNPKRVLVAVVAACSAGMLLGSTVTLAVMQRSVGFPTSGLVVGLNFSAHTSFTFVLDTKEQISGFKQ